MLFQVPGTLKAYSYRLAMKRVVEIMGECCLMDQEHRKRRTTGRYETLMAMNGAVLFHVPGTSEAYSPTGLYEKCDVDENEGMLFHVPGTSEA